ncbi:hypothetical protein LTR95_000945 [Oleoguttula sp. CCFEE 5521]
MATAAVLTLPELLETIMRHLDMKTLLLSQRVDRQWKSVIKSSKVLREKLFLSIRPCTTGSHAVTLNPLLTRQRHNDENDYCPDEWLFALDPFTLPLHASARRMYISDQGGIMRVKYVTSKVGMMCTASGLVPYIQEGAPEEDRWLHSGRDIINLRMWEANYTGQTLDGFLAKVTESQRRRKLMFLGFEWTSSNWEACSRPYRAVNDSQ